VHFCPGERSDFSEYLERNSERPPSCCWVANKYNQGRTDCLRGSPNQWKTAYLRFCFRQILPGLEADYHPDDHHAARIEDCRPSDAKRHGLPYHRGGDRIDQEGKTFTAKKNFVWTCNKDTKEQAYNDGNVVAIMRITDLMA
jgi:hypothetical protein